MASCFASGVALANPNGFSVVNGQVFFSYNGNVLNVTNSPGSIINWQGFSIGANEITRFIQQSASSTVLNRVVGVDPSIILGALQSNGRVFLINPNGVVFGAGAKVDVAGLVASTLNLSNADFLAGRARFTDTPGAGNVVNQGTITTPSGGQVYLIAPNVQNHGIINSPQGEVILAAGKTVEIVDSGTPNLRVELTASNNEALNVGKIVANSGKIGIYAGLIKNSGEVRADGVVVGANGEILLKAVKNVALDKGSIVSASGPTAGKVTIQADTGTVTVGGTLEANATQGKGGAINVAGQQGVSVESGGRITANGTEGGSVVLSSAAGNVSVAGIVTADASASRAGSVSLIAANAALLAAGGQMSASGGTGGGVVTTKAGSGVTFELGSSVQANGAAGGSVVVVADAGAFTGQGTIEVIGADLNGGSVNIATRNDITLADESRILAGGRAGGDVRIESTEGTLLASGLIDGQGRNGPGGKVYLLAPRVALVRRALIDVTGETGGGTILVGGDFQGSNPDVQNAWRTYVGRDVILRADGGVSGNGGKVIVWADDITRFYGTVSAQGGSQSGDGGFVEISGKHNLDFSGAVNTGAVNGKSGKVLFDPDSITVVASGGLNDAEVSGDGETLFGDGGAVAFTINEAALEAIAGDITLRANNSIVVGPGLVGGLDLTANGQHLTLETSSATSNITISSPIVTNGYMRFYSNSMNINANLTSNNDSIYLIPVNFSGTSINLGGADGAGVLGLSAAELNRVHLLNPAATLQIGDPLFGGNITVSAALTSGAGGATQNFQNLKLNSGSGNSIDINAPISVGDSLRLETGGEIRQTAAGVITVPNLLAVSVNNDVRLDTANNMVGTVAGHAVGNFLFKNAQSLTVGSVLGANGITVDGAEGGGAASAVITLVGAGSMLTVNRTISVNDNHANDTSATISLTAPAGIHISGDGGEGNIGLFAYGGYGYYLNGQPATITLNGGSGPVVVDNVVSVVADGGDGGTGGGGPGGAGNALVTIGTTGQVTIASGSFVQAAGGHADIGTSNNGGNATLAISSGAAGILFNGAEGNVDGGDAGNSGGNGGMGTITLNGGGGLIKLDQSTQLRADGGHAPIGMGGDAAISLTNASSIVIDNTSSIVADAAFGSSAGGVATVNLTAATGAVGIMLDHGSSVEALGGGSDGVGGAGTINFNAGSGAIVLDNGAFADAIGGNSTSDAGGSASIVVTNASGLTLSNGADLYAEGGGGLYGGGAASVTVTTSGAAGINLNSGAYIKAYGGHGGDGGEGSGTGGDATVNLTANGAGGINLAGGFVYAIGGNAYYDAGNAEINLTTTGTGAILVSGGGRVDARGGNGGDGGESFVTGNGGHAMITLESHGGISIVGSGSGVNAYGGHGGVSSDHGSGGNATVNLNNTGAAGITIDGGEGYASGGNGGFSYGSAGDAALTLDGGSGPILVMNGGRARAFGGVSYDNFYGGDANVSLATSGNIFMFNGTVSANGGAGYSKTGVASVSLASSGGAITITNSTVSATGGEGADVAITGNIINIAGSTISADGAEGAGIGLNAAGQIAISLSSSLLATSSEDYASIDIGAGGMLHILSNSTIHASGNYADITLSGNTGVTANLAQISANTPSFGNASVTITSSGGNVNLLNSSITVDDGAGGHVYDGNVVVTAGAGNVDIAGTTLIKVLGDGGEGSAGTYIGITAANGYIHGGPASMLQANNVNFTNDPTIQLTAKHGIGAIGSPIRISDDQPVGHITNTTSGDIVLAQVNGSTSIDNVADVINTAVNGGLDFTTENGSIVLTNSTVFSANGAGKVGLHALGAGHSIQIDAGSRVVTNGGTATLQADNIFLSGAANEVSAGASGVVALGAASVGQIIDLGGSNGGGTLGVDMTTLASINAGTLRLGDIMNTGGIQISGANVGTIDKLSLVTGGNITQSGALAANNLALKSNGSVTLNDVTNSVGYVAADLTGGTGSLSYKATGFNVAGSAIDGVAGVKTNGGNITLTSPNVGEGIFVVSSGPGYTIDTGITGGTVTINSADWLVVNDFADIRGAQVNLNSTHPLGVALGQIRIDATGSSPTAVNINASAPAGTVISSADIYSAGGVTINAGGYIELDSNSTGSTIAATGPVNITAGTSISAYGSSPASAWMQVTGSTVTMDAGTFINLGSVTGHGLRATSGNVNISAVDSIGGLTPGAMKGPIVADNGNVLISVTGPGGFFDMGDAILAPSGTITLDNSIGGAMGGSINIAGPVSAVGNVVLKANDFINLGSGGVSSGGGIVLVNSGDTLTSSGVISAPTINLASVGGMSAVVRNAGAGVTATNTGGGDLIVSADALTPLFTVGAGGASFSNTVGSGYYINAANNMDINGFTAGSTYARFAAGGTLTVNGYTNVSAFGTLFAANNIDFNNGGVTIVSGALGIIGGTVNVNSTTVQGGTVNVTATTLNVASGDFKSDAGDFIGTIAGNVAVSAGGRIYGAPDVRLTVGGNIMIDGAGSKIEAASASSVHVLFPLLADGGYIINGQPGVVWDPVTNTGFFAGGLPAALGNGFFVEYGAIPIDALASAVVVAINSAIDATNKSAPSTEKDKDKDKDKEKTADAGTGGGAGKVELQCN